MMQASASCRDQPSPFNERRREKALRRGCDRGALLTRPERHDPRGIPFVRTVAQRLWEDIPHRSTQQGFRPLPRSHKPEKWTQTETFKQSLIEVGKRHGMRRTGEGKERLVSKGSAKQIPLKWIGKPWS
jgi:hypothetical protein